MSQRKSDRPPYGTRTFRLVDEVARQRCIAMLSHAPLDKLRPLEVLIREPQRARKPDQQALLFAGPLRDISEQAYFEGKQYSVEVLHEYMKREFLPEDFDPEECLEGYKKWDLDPAGRWLLVGSTKQLTVKGYSNYLEAVYSFGASMGVMFTERRNYASAP